MTNAWWDEDQALTYQNYPKTFIDGTGAEACDRLLSRVGLPSEIERLVRQNQTWFLPRLREMVYDGPYYPKDYAREITFPVAEGWSRFNPSVAADPDGNLKIIVRSSNYTVGPDMIYHFPIGPNGAIETHSYIADVKSDLSPYNIYFIQDNHLLNDPPPFPVVGIEDCRLFWHDGRWRFSGTMRDRHPSGICQMVMATIHGSVATDLHVLSSRRRHEKNWMPLVREVRRFGSHDPRWVYSCSPFLIVNHRGTVHQGSLASPYIARHFRGGSQVIPVDDGLRGLALVHESVNFDSPPRRVYQHRFILIDHTTGKLVRISPPFCFEGRGLEFAAGLAMMGDDLVISYGIDDARAYLMKVPLDRVFGLLRDPLPEEG